MKYILIDTNIFLDMLIDRKNQVSNKLVESFEKLLDYDEIKVVAPAIVIHETYKHIDEELDKVRGKLDTAIKNIESLYGVNAYTVDGLDIKQYKKKSKKELQDAIDMFDKNKATYQTEIINLINKIFQHKNTIVIPDDEKLILECMKRRVYKKAPFHIEKKDSFADGVITETLINIRDIINIDTDDEMFFVTGNYKDFSESGDHADRNKLHSDIIEDLIKQAINDKVIYVRSFHQLIGVSLKDEVENANLKKSFQCELEEQEEYIRHLSEIEYSDNMRERGGLSSLSGFEGKLQDDLQESGFSESVCEFFDNMNLMYSQLDECALFYEDELLNYFNGLKIIEMPEALKKINEFFDSNSEARVSLSVVGLDSVREWIKLKVNETSYDSDEIALPDCINFDESITFLGFEKEPYTLILDKLELNPENGDQEEIDFCIRDKNDNKVANGYVQVTYGFVEEDDDGGIDDACDEDIDYFTIEIEEFFKEKEKELEEFKNKHESMVNKLRMIFNLLKKSN